MQLRVSCFTLHYAPQHNCIKAGFRPACHLPLCRVMTAGRFSITALSGHAISALSPMGITLKFNRIELSAIYRQYRGKWPLHSRTNITIEVAIRPAASWSESNIKVPDIGY